MGGNARLRVLNPLVGERLGRVGHRILLCVQSSAASAGMSGVSSFGYSGTIAHAVLAFGSGGDREALAFGRDPDPSEALAFGSRGAEAAGGGVSAKVLGNGHGALDFRTPLDAAAPVPSTRLPVARCSQPELHSGGVARDIQTAHLAILINYQPL